MNVGTSQDTPGPGNKYGPAQQRCQVQLNPGVEVGSSEPDYDENFRATRADGASNEKSGF